MQGRVASVVENELGSELEADALAGATSLDLVSLEDFDWEGGQLEIGTEVIAYTIDEETEALTLATPLAAGYSAEEQVFVYPRSIERLAYILADNQEEELEARVPHALFDRLPLGVREEGPEVVEAGQYDDELVVADVIGSPPVIDGSYIDPETLPPAIAEPDTDGLAPSVSPVPTSVGGGPGYLVPQWTLIANPDAVIYEVHMSVTSGFTPDATTKVGETPSSIFFIRSLPNGDPLLYPTEPDNLDNIYYIKIIAKDFDGAAAPSAELGGQMRRITGPDIVTDAIAARHLIADEAMFAKLQSLMIITNTLKTAESGARIELGQLGPDVSGLRAIMADEDVALEFSTATGQARFYGDLVAATCTILGNLLIQGTTNKLDGGATMTLSGQNPADPTTPIVATIDNEVLTLQAPADPLLASGMLVNSGQACGMFYDAAGHNPAGGTQPTWLTTGYVPDAGAEWENQPGICVYEHRASDGAFVRGFIYGKAGALTRVCGIVRIGPKWWVLSRSATSNTLYLLGFDPANPTVMPVSSPDLTPYFPSIIKSYLALATDGTDPFIYGADDNVASTPMRRVRINLASSYAATHVDYTGINFSGRSTADGGHFFLGAVRVAGKDWVMHNKGGYIGPNSWDVTSLAVDAETGFACDDQGIGHDGTRFWTRAANQLVKHTNWTWTSTEIYLAWAYSWLNAAQTQETKAGARTFMRVRQDPSDANRALRRNRIKLSIPPFPAIATRYRIYEAHSTSQTTILDTALRRQAATAQITSETARPTYQSAENVAGANPRTSSNWPAADSTLNADAAGFVSSPSLSGKGMIRKGRVTTAFRGGLVGQEAEELYDTDLDMPLHHDGTDWRGFLELVDLAHRKVKFGKAQTAVFGNTPSAIVTFAHGMGAIPLIVLCTPDRSGAGGVGWRLIANAEADATNITLYARTNNDTNATGSCFIWWLAIW